MYCTTILQHLDTYTPPQNKYRATSPQYISMVPTERQRISKYKMSKLKFQNAMCSNKNPINHFFYQFQKVPTRLSISTIFHQFQFNIFSIPYQSVFIFFVTINLQYFNSNSSINVLHFYPIQISIIKVLIRTKNENKNHDYKLSHS